ncbi:TLD domain-containing protein 1 isoform X1 [Heterocephalus glaber]|nr:TLD domain-containing protein 1 isoform X1 [Heterocephalus glaber]XP_021112266.1 TLD domain-containing protein 1 isoform X1 [Heterocephalus glaber]XP_021112267.1 TLD domain-containing protein 1 isoform X1 [Heterocephalus glaber]XP_021112268.1 TLD domain-containing protein 1 isoform X1 [Heterocephalus glaber]
MGNSKSHSGRTCCSQFLPEEQAEIDRLFDALSSQKDGAETSPRSFSLKALQARTTLLLGASVEPGSHVGEALPPEMLARLYDGMRQVCGTGPAQGSCQSVSREQFTVSLSHLLRGSSEERSVVILKMISASGGPVKAREVRKFTEDLVGSVVHVLSHRQELRGWAGKEAPGAPARTQALAAQLLSELKLPGGERLQGPQWLEGNCDRAAIEDWVFRVPRVAMFLSVVVHRGLLVLGVPPDLAMLVPERQVEPGQELTSLLDVLAVIFLSSHLAPRQRHCWRLLFASHLHGQSFSQLCGRVTHRGPCLALLEDRSGHVFGGFASCSWEVKPQFQGDNKCFLFSIAPSMAVYTPTGYNDHYMYLNHSQQTIPNGLGMGGQHSYFGLWVDADFGNGHSKAKPTCTTYDSPQLSAEEDFRFEKMEVWAVGEPVESELAKGKKSVLDVDPGAQILLEATGWTRQSAGFPEIPDSHSADQ